MSVDSILELYQDPMFEYLMIEEYGGDCWLEHFSSGRYYRARDYGLGFLDKECKDIHKIHKLDIIEVLFKVIIIKRSLGDTGRSMYLTRGARNKIVEFFDRVPEITYHQRLRETGWFFVRVR